MLLQSSRWRWRYLLQASWQVTSSPALHFPILTDSKGNLPLVSIRLCLRHGPLPHYLPYRSLAARMHTFPVTGRECHRSARGLDRQ